MRVLLPMQGEVIGFGVRQPIQESVTLTKLALFLFTTQVLSEETVTMTLLTCTPGPLRATSAHLAGARGHPRSHGAP